MSASSDAFKALMLACKVDLTITRYMWYRLKATVELLRQRQNADMITLAIKAAASESDFANSSLFFVGSGSYMYKHLGMMN